MINCNKRLLPNECERFRKVNADPERWLEAGTRGYRNRVYRGNLAFGNEFKKCFGEPGSRANISEMLARVSSEIICLSSCNNSASSSAASRIGTRFFACSRFASEGKTPPYCLCNSICERSALPTFRELSIFFIACTFEYRNRGLVAGGLNREYFHFLSVYSTASAYPIRMRNPEACGCPLPPYFCAIFETSNSCSRFADDTSQHIAVKIHDDAYGRFYSARGDSRLPT